MPAGCGGRSTAACAPAMTRTTVDRVRDSVSILTSLMPAPLPAYPPDGHPRCRDLPAGHRAAFRTWLEEGGHSRPLIPGVAPGDFEGQDGYWPWDYARWRAEALSVDSSRVIIGEAEGRVLTSSRCTRVAVGLLPMIVVGAPSQSQRRPALP